MTDITKQDINALVRALQKDSASRENEADQRKNIETGQKEIKETLSLVREQLSGVKMGQASLERRLTEGFQSVNTRIDKVETENRNFAAKVDIDYKKLSSQVTDLKIRMERNEARKEALAEVENQQNQTNRHGEVITWQRKGLWIGGLSLLAGIATFFGWESLAQFLKAAAQV